MGSIERKVWIFDPKDVLPTEEDTFGGLLLALDTNGEWESTSFDIVRDRPEWFLAWMQYPDLKNHEEKFYEAY